MVYSVEFLEKFTLKHMQLILSVLVNIVFIDNDHSKGKYSERVQII